MYQPSASRFFDRQALARRRTLQIIFLFPLSLASVAAAFHALYFLYTIFSMQWVFMEDPLASPYRPERIGLVHLLAAFVVLFGMVRAWWTMSGGGVIVAQRLGGRLADPNSTLRGEKRWINVVEEMAVAARIPTPGIYILDQQNGINAFAAGFTPDDAVVAITRGGLEWLTRDELQGVAAHEIGHIVHGDSRLNMRIMILLSGVQTLPSAGRAMVENSYKSLELSGMKQGGGLALFGFIAGYAMWFLGSLALFFNRLIQAAVARQREHLADASAIQYSRNPQGLSQALQKIGGFCSGSRIRDSLSEEYRHFYFSQTSVPSMFDWTDTHPSLHERIRLLDPSFTGTFPRLIQGRWYGLNESEESNPQPTDEELDINNKGGSGGMAWINSFKEMGAILSGVHHNLIQASRQRITGICLLYALLITESSSRKESLASLSQSETDFWTNTINNFINLIEKIDGATQLALVRLSTMSLAGLNLDDRAKIMKTINTLIRLDNKISLVEYSIEKIVHRTLVPEDFKVPGHRRVSSFRKHGEHVSVCLSLMARIAGDPPADAFARGVACLGRDRGWQLLPAGSCGLKAMDRALGELAVLGDEHLRVLIKAIHATLPLETPPTLNALWLYFATIAILNQPIPVSFWTLLARRSNDDKTMNQ
ncbi:MAG: M48 family metalloprotease [Magnetococcales bacterium]|nr:M48 family metalloprotease [Magnetococcales bacterium]